MALEAECRVSMPLMTEEEFDAWCAEDTRAEFVDGQVIPMSPSATIRIRIARFLTLLIGGFLEARPAGELLTEGCQIRPRPGLRREPDLLYVTAEHADRVRPTYFHGAPDACWETVSPESEDRDYRDKYHDYEQAGVRECWLIDPYSRTVWLYRLNAGGRYEPVKAVDGRLTSEVVPGFWMRPEWLWREPLPKAMECLREIGALP